MNYFAIGVIAIIVYFMVYAIIDRICNCVEHCARCKTVGGRSDERNNNDWK